MNIEDVGTIELDISPPEVAVGTIRKRLVIGDIHGHIEPFMSIYNKEDPDDVIILGDYFDSFTGTDQDIVNCFKDILEAQKKHKKGEFILIIGNHDFHYMDLSETYSGKRNSYAIHVSILLDKCLEKKLMQYVYVDEPNKTVYSHAGITNSWLSENRLFISTLTDLNDIDPRKYRFTYRGGDSGIGDGPYASPIWVRPSTLEKDLYIDNNGCTWTQIVGHTHYSKSKTLTLDGTWLNGCTKYVNKPGTLEEGLYAPLIYVIDSLPNYYIIEELNEDGILISREVKSTQANLDKAVNDKIQLNNAIKRGESIKKLAELCGIKIVDPID